MRTIFLPLLLALVAPLVAQDPGKPPAESSDAEQRPAPEPTIQELIDRLGDSKFDARRQAEEALRQRGKDAAQALEGAAEHHDDPEVRWRARRLARRLERGDAAGALRPRSQEPEPRDDESRPPSPGTDLDDMFGSLFGRLERDFGIDIPRQRFFQDDFFRDLERQMDAMRAQMRGQWGPLQPLGADVQGQSMQLQIGPNGVKLEVEERGGDGKVEKKTYEAPDLGTFRDKYPDVARRYLGQGNGGRVQLGPPPGSGGWPGLPRLPGLTPLPAPAEEPSGPRLGVHVRPAGDDLRAFLGLDEGQGLVVDGVEADSLAEVLGLRAGDVVLEVAGRAVGSPVDVRQALRAAGDRVAVRINRRGAEQTLEADKPKDLDQAGKSAAEGLRPRTKTVRD